MANEFSVTVDMALTSGLVDHVWSPGSISANMTAPIYIENVISVGTTDETVSFGDVTVEYVGLQNLDSTNYVQFSDNATTYLGRIAAGQVAYFPIDSGATLHLKANTDACNVLVVGYGT